MNVAIIHVADEIQVERLLQEGVVVDLVVVTVSAPGSHNSQAVTLVLLARTCQEAQQTRVVLGVSIQPDGTWTSHESVTLWLCQKVQTMDRQRLNKDTDN